MTPPSSGAVRDVATAVVLAAGRGSRLDSDTPKPLTRVLGLPLLGRTLHTLHRGGVTRAHVVVGFEAERVRRDMERWIPRGLEVEWIENPKWEQPNGVSVLAAEDSVDGPFFLTMSDHVFSVDVLHRLRAAGLDGINLAVDRDVDSVLDPDDATRVEVRDGRIAAIGKGLEEFDAIDTGVFLATPAIFEALRAERGDDGVSLSAGVQRLAASGSACVTDVTGAMWQDVDTLEDLAEARRKLVAALRKPSDGWVARNLNRPVSILLTRLLVNTPVTPNQVSFSTLVMSVVSAWWAASGTYGGFLAAAALFHFASIVDGTDGEIAKLKFQYSRYGEWVDTTCDSVGYLAFLAGVIVGVQRAGFPPVYVWGGVLGLVVSVLSVLNLAAAVRRDSRSGSFQAVQYGYRKGTSFFDRVLRAASFAGKRDFLALFALGMAAIGHLPLGLPMFGVGVTLLLLPATLQANVSSWLRARRGAVRAETSSTQDSDAPSGVSGRLA